METILTPCLPRRSCVICESRLYPKAASPAKKAAKYAHQAEWWGREALAAVYAGDAARAALLTTQAAGFARLVLAAVEAVAA